MALLCLSAVLLIPQEVWVLGGAAWLGSALLAWYTREPALQRRLGVLLGCVAVLAAAPVNTDTSTSHILGLGSVFVFVVVAPSWLLGRTDPVTVRYRFWPSRLRWMDLLVIVISIPITWAGLRLYFSLSPEVAQNWALPPQPEGEALFRLFMGINAVGIWDEMFFVNISFAILRSLYPFRMANLAQAVIYTAVLNDMAFTGVGPLFVYTFALIQGTLFEKTENLLYVLVVHLVVDYFLFQEIVTSYYPAFSAWWHP